MVPDSYGEFWKYLSKTQQDLILEGDYMLNNVIRGSNYSFKDYSFLIFPYAKSYEGFLKQLFLDVGFLSHLDYISDHLRIGKLLSPNLVRRLGERSLFLKIENSSSLQLANLTWDAWKLGRNQVFHYFPHNLKAVSFSEAEEIISQLIKTMEQIFIAYKDHLKPHVHKEINEQLKV